jgi:uncharacterized protein (DUF983 family)
MSGAQTVLTDTDLTVRHCCMTCGQPYAAGRFASGTALFVVCAKCKSENRLVIP